MSVICGRCCAFHACCAVMSASTYAGSGGKPRPGRDDERHPPRVALLDVGEQPGDPLVAAALVPRERMPVGGDRRRAGREQQGVVAQALPVLRDDDAVLVVDRGDDLGHEPRAGVAGDLRHGHVTHAVAEEQ